MKKEPNKYKIPMPKQPVEVRIKNFNEVALGYTEEDAIAEASRCLMCKKPTCIDGCPVEIDIPGFIQKILERDFLAAIYKIKEKNSLPAICGRVCPQEDQCEKTCTLGKRYEPVAIGRLERFVADYELRSGEIKVPERLPPTGKKIAVVGSGPAGLTAAADLAKKGHSVTIFEALHRPGGVLVYGIPEFRLPKVIVDREINYIKSLGVEIKLDCLIGRLNTIDELLQNGFDAVFIGVGAGLPNFLNIPGENYNGIYSANEFLTRINLMKAFAFPEYDTPIKVGKRVAIIGGGNVAIDASRSALRLGAEHVYCIYRRSPAEIPARKEEVKNAQDEGIEFIFLAKPTRFIGNKEGYVKAVECIKMKLGEPDESGRPFPIPIEGTEFIIDADVVVIAIGNGANPLLGRTTSDLQTNKWGYIIVDEKTGKTSKERVYAGGDIVTGEATVVSAMAAGKRSAEAIDRFVVTV